MKFLFLRTIPVLALCGLFFSSSVAAQQHSDAPLTNAAVVKLVRAGFKEKTVIAIIRSRPNRFELDPDRLIDLKRNGVTEKVILTMLALDDSPVTDDDWENDSFFKRNGKATPADGGEPRNGEADIFGSSGGSNSQQSSRGLKGGNQGETTTTGSATVRIVRPPSEAGGGAPLKLEKTPTLTNESIIQLVEAGFSEGTIIKRIEDSPADFDLSPAKLDELRKRRVPDSIITAMTAAMDDSGLKTGGPARSGDN
jgi:hypothetical protein